MILAFVILMPVGLQAQKKYNPVLKLKKGETLTYISNSNIDMVQNMMGQEMEMKITSASKNIINITDIDKAGNYIVKQTSKENVIEMNMGIMDTVMQIPEITNLPEFVVDKFGNIVSKTNPEPSTEGQGGADFNSMNSASLFVEFPGRKIVAGDTWAISRTDSIPFMGGTLTNKIKTNYTFEGVEKKNETECYKITYKGGIENEGATTMQGMDFYIEGTGAMQGTTWVSVKTGVPVLDESIMENEMTLALTGQQNLTIPITYNIKSTRKLAD
jgi:hypothetical protein